MIIRLSPAHAIVNNCICPFNNKKIATSLKQVAHFLFLLIDTSAVSAAEILDVFGRSDVADLKA